MKHKNSSSKSESFQTGEFATVRINAEHKAEFLHWATAQEHNVLAWLEDLTSESYRVSFRRDYHNNCNMVSLTQQDPKHHNFNVIIVSRADDAVKAFLMSVYKVNMMYPGERLPTEPQFDNWG